MTPIGMPNAATNTHCTRRAAALAVLAVPALAWLPGCASAPKPTPVNGTIRADARLNPSVSRRPSPLLLRVYELRAAALFSSADFVSLFQSDQSALAAEMVGREEFFVQPGETRSFRKVFAPDVRFLGVLAAYRDLERSAWRAVVALKQGSSQNVLITAGELAVSVALQN